MREIHRGRDRGKYCCLEKTPVAKGLNLTLSFPCSRCMYIPYLSVGVASTTGVLEWSVCWNSVKAWQFSESL